MDLVELKHRAEKEVELHYDAWADLSDAERTTIIYQKMLAILEEDDQALFKNILLTARAAWEEKAWAWTGYDSFVEFLCDVGGRYRQADGRPSGVTYDLEGYICIAWPILEERGLNPVEVAISNWSKARLMIATVRQSVKLLRNGEEVERTRDAKKVVVLDEPAVARVIKQATDPEISVREMANQVCEQRVPGWEATARLNKNGTWSIDMEDLTPQQWELAQRLMERYVKVRLE